MFIVFLVTCFFNNQKQSLEVFCKKSVLRDFRKFIGKHLCQSLFLKNVSGSPCNFIIKEALAQVFSCEFCEISKTSFFHRTPPVAALLILNASIDCILSIERFEEPLALTCLNNYHYKYYVV